MNPENAILDSFRTIFADPGIDRDVNFFSCGGDSLRALRLVNRLQETLGVRIRLVDLARNPTPAALAALVRKQLEQAQTTV
jgi:aryl carrier-like protein